jgi:membrane protein DedA with SNARE-associated domain
MDPLGNLVEWIAIYGIFGLFAIGLAERFLPALPSYGVLVAIGIAADDGGFKDEVRLANDTNGLSLARKLQ